MPALTNPRHEAFCRAYVRGKTAGNASASWIAAGYKENRKTASAALQRQDISGRIAELQAQVASIESEALAIAVKETGITKTRVFNELGKLGFANMLDYIRVNGNGDAVVDLSALDRDKASCIQEVIVETYDEGRGDDARTVKKIKFRLCDKHSALVSLGRHFGMFIDVVKTPDIADAVARPMVDAPPPETFEEWTARRERELAPKKPVAPAEKGAARRK